MFIINYSYKISNYTSYIPLPALKCANSIKILDTAVLLAVAKQKCVEPPI